MFAGMPDCDAIMCQAGRATKTCAHVWALHAHHPCLLNCSQLSGKNQGEFYLGDQVSYLLLQGRGVLLGSCAQLLLILQLLPQLLHLPQNVGRLLSNKASASARDRMHLVLQW